MFRCEVQTMSTGCVFFFQLSRLVFLDNQRSAAVEDRCADAFIKLQGSDFPLLTLGPRELRCAMRELQWRQHDRIVSLTAMV